MDLKRVVITGLGTINPLGHNVPEFWDNLLKGVSGAGPITRFDASKFRTQFACEVKNYEPTGYFDKKEVRKMDLYTQFGIIAAREALKDSGLDLETANKKRIGVIWGAGIGEWGTGILSAEDEKAWKRSNLWHGIILGIAGVLFALYLIFGDPRIYFNNAKLEKTLSALDCDSITLEEIVPFEWTTVYTFDPYTSKERIERVVGSKSPALKKSVSEGMNHVVFTNRGRVVASVCTHPASTGYYLSFTGGENTYYSYSDGGYSHIEYGDEIVFEVMQDDGFVRLYARVEE